MNQGIKILIVTFFYVVFGKIGLILAYVNPSTSAVWPPAGFALAVLLAYGYRLWPGIFLGALIVNFFTAGTFLTSLSIATGNTLEGVVAAYLVNHFARGRSFFDHPYDVFKFALLGAGLSTLISATVGTATLVLGDMATFADFSSIWLTWWLGDAGGILVVTPFLLLLTYKPKDLQWNMRQVGELLLTLSLFGLNAWALYAKGYGLGTIRDPLQFLFTPLILWTAFRWTSRETSAAVLLLAAISAWGTSRGYGPFVSGHSPNDSLLILQCYLGIMSIMGLSVAAVVAERRRALKSSEARFQRLIQSNVIGIIETDERGTIRNANAAFLDLIGYNTIDLEKGQINTQLLTPEEFLTQESWAFEQLLNRGSCPPLEKDFFHRDGHRIPVLVGAVRLDRSPMRSVSFVIDATQRRQAMQALRRAYDEIELRVNERTKELTDTTAELLREVERRKNAEDVLRNQSMTDPLTGLYNRRGFLLLAEQQWKQALREKRELLFYFADVDGLKPINDRLGHAMGDDAIIHSGEALRETFRSVDVLGRIGGDEFAIVVLDVPPHGEPEYIERLKKSLEERNASGRLPFHLSLSIGMARFDFKETTTISELMRRADEDLYTIKANRPH